MAVSFLHYSLSSRLSKDSNIRPGLIWSEAAPEWWLSHMVAVLMRVASLRAESAKIVVRAWMHEDSTSKKFTMPHLFGTKVKVILVMSVLLVHPNYTQELLAIWTDKSYGLRLPVWSYTSWTIEGCLIYPVVKVHLVYNHFYGVSKKIKSFETLINDSEVAMF